MLRAIIDEIVGMRFESATTGISHKVQCNTQR